MIINGIKWSIKAVPISSPKLQRADGSATIGMTDGRTHCLYIAQGLRGGMLKKVLAHELTHAFMFSYNIKIDIEIEEFIADWVATYGEELIILLDEILQAAKKTG